MLTPNSHMNPVYDRREIDAVKDYMFSDGWIMEHTVTREMESKICEYTGAKHAHMVPSATMGLLLASMLSDIQPSEHFDCPAYTQAATANGSILMGAFPEFIDVDPVSYTIDFSRVKNRVVYVTSINGRYPVNARKEIMNLRDRGHFVIEDSAQALGSWHQGHHIGTMGHVGVFSFGAPKIITTGQGGCIVTNDDAISERIHAIKNFGRTVGIGETYNIMGMNFKFTDLQAAFGCEQMNRLPKVVNRKKEIYTAYRRLLGDTCEFVATNVRTTTPTYPEILVDDRDALAEHLRSQNIGCRAVYSSLAKQPYHGSRFARHAPVTERIGSRGLQLPGQANLTDADIVSVCTAIKDYYKQ